MSFFEYCMFLCIGMTFGAFFGWLVMRKLSRSGSVSEIKGWWGMLLALLYAASK